MKSMLKPIIAIAVVALILFGSVKGFSGIAAANEDKEMNEMLAAILPGSTSFTWEEYDGEDEAIQAVYKGENGFVIQTSAYGYAGNVARNSLGITTGIAETPTGPGSDGKRPGADSQRTHSGSSEPV